MQFAGSSTREQAIASVMSYVTSDPRSSLRAIDRLPTPLPHVPRCSIGC